MMAISLFSKLHKSPDSEYNCDDKHSDKESQGVDQLRTEGTKGGMRNPWGQYCRPSLINDAGSTISEYWMSGCVRAIDAVSGFPNQDYTAEETN